MLPMVHLSKNGMVQSRSALPPQLSRSYQPCAYRIQRMRRIRRAATRPRSLWLAHSWRSSSSRLRSMAASTMPPCARTCSSICMLCPLESAAGCHSAGRLTSIARCGGGAVGAGCRPRPLQQPHQAPSRRDLHGWQQNGGRVTHSRPGH